METLHLPQQYSPRQRQAGDLVGVTQERQDRHVGGPQLGDLGVDDRVLAGRLARGVPVVRDDDREFPGERFYLWQFWHGPSLP